MELLVKKRNGRLENLNTDKINKCVERACEGLEDVSASEIVLDAGLQLYNKIPTAEIDKALILSAKSKIEKEPNYSYVAARLLLNVLYKEVLGKGITRENISAMYRDTFVKHLKKLVKEDRIDERLIQKFDLDKLAATLKPERDLFFKYLGIQTLYDRYFIHLKERRMETPQSFFMRIAMGLCLHENNPTDRAIEFYEEFSQFNYLPSTPTLFNSGTTHPQLSSCYLSTVEDSIDGIFGTIHGQARLSKYAGGLGVDWTPIRSTNSYIKGTNGKSTGIVPWLKVYNDMLLSVDQGGKRKGAGVAYLESWHGDIEEFFELRKNTGDERRRCHDMHTAHWVCDEFLSRVERDEDWYLFSPSDCPDLHGLYGRAFTERYEAYIQEAEAGNLPFTKVRAKELWKKNLTALFETGHPWITFKDASNIRYSDQHVGAVHNSNLCCMTADQLVATNLGLLTVGELYQLQKPIKVVGRERVEKASEMFMPRPNAPIVKIVTKQGYTHKVTPDHKVWIEDFGWKEAKDLQQGDKIAIQQFEGMWGEFDDEDLGFIIGLIMGDGTFSDYAAIIDLWKDKYFDTERIEACVARIIAKYHNGQCNNCHQLPKFNECTNKEKARLNSAALSKILYRLCKFDKETKLTIPKLILRSSRRTVAAFLEGLYLSDATVQADNQYTISSITSINRNLLETLQIIWANFGVKSVICDNHSAGSRLMPNGRGGHTYYDCQQSWRLLITSIRGNRIVEEVTKIGKYRKHEYFLFNTKKSGYRQKFYADFSHLEELPNEDAFCLRVNSEEHSWTVNGLITKNTEILRHTFATKWKNGNKDKIGETAVCNLSSINLAAHIINNRLDFAKLAKTVRKAIRGLDNVIDINFYPTEEAKNSNLKHRPVGLGLMGLADVFHAYNLEFGSDAANKLSCQIQEFISWHAIDESCNLAAERGAYSTFEGSTWSRGILPIDTYEILTAGENRLKYNYETTCDWESLRKRVRYGVRNANTMAIAPTATISYIAGCSQSIEPDFSALFVYTTLSGNFTMVNEWFVREMKKLGLWSPAVVDKLKQHDGDVKYLDIPDELKRRFATAFDIPANKLIEGAATRQIWIDMGQSLNLYLEKPSLKALSDMYMLAWKMGLKTTYYLRTKAVSKVEKNAVAAKVEPEVFSQVCDRSDPNCESCQ